MFSLEVWEKRSLKAELRQRLASSRKLNVLLPSSHNANYKLKMLPIYENQLY